MAAPNLVMTAIKLLGSEQKLADAIGYSQPAINKAKKSKRVSAEFASRVHKATKGKVSRSALRPDLFAEGK